MFHREVQAEIEIDAPPQEVWEVLAEIGRWSEWNSVMKGLTLRGPLQEGTRGKVMLNVGGPLGVRPIPVRLVTVREGRELAWVGGLPGVMVGRHGLRLEPRGQGTRFVHEETFTGALTPPLMRALGPRLLSGYRKFNEKLRERCEQRC